MHKEYIELQQYRDYAASTQHLNEALNKELSMCYERIEKMIKELTES